MEPGLYVVGTPIGNLEDLTQRALATLRGAAAILAEDTRRTRRLLSRYGIHVPLMSCHRFNEAARLEVVVRRLEEGAAVALVTDSGMPAVSDPGARVVAACRARGFRVTVVPGPSSVSTAIALAGFDGDRFVFDGFLPRKHAARTQRLAEFAAERRTIVFFESPHRLVSTLEGMVEALGDRPIFIGRELTKRFEQCVSGTAAELLSLFQARRIRGEIVCVISAASD